MHYSENSNPIVDGIIFGLQRAGGISRVWSTLIPEFIANFINFKYIEPESASQNIYRAAFNIEPTQKEALRKTSKFVCQKLITEPGIYIPTYYRPANKNQRCIQVCHDTIREESIGKLLLPALKMRRRALYDQAERIVCVSNATRSDLLEHYGESIYRKAVVILNPLDSTRMIKMAAETPELRFANIPSDMPFALYLGKRDGAKNFSESLALLAQTAKLNLHLVVVGSSFSQAEESLLAPFRSRVVNLGTISDEALAKVMASASFLFLPSKKEGFGFPTVEALSLGTPVVCTDTEINREVSLGLAEFYPSGSEEALLAAVNSAMSRQRLSAAETALIRDAYAPRKIAKQYLSCINELA